MVLANKSSKIQQLTKEIGTRTQLKVKAPTFGTMGARTLDRGQIINYMATESSNGAMDARTPVSSSLISKRATESMNGLMAKFTMDSGWQASSMARRCLPILKGKVEEEDGKMVRGLSGWELL